MRNISVSRDKQRESVFMLVRVFGFVGLRSTGWMLVLFLILGREWTVLLWPEEPESSTH